MATSLQSCRSVAVRSTRGLWLMHSDFLRHGNDGKYFGIGFCDFRTQLSAIGDAC